MSIVNLITIYYERYMKKKLSEFTNKLNLSAKKYGASSSYSIAISSKEVSLEVRNKKPEKIESSNIVNIGLRVFIGNQNSIISGTVTKDFNTDELALKAISMAKVAPKDNNIGIANDQQIAKKDNLIDLELFDKEETYLDPVKLKEISSEIEEAALENENIFQCESSGISYSTSQISLSTSNGFEGGNVKTNYQLYCSSIAKDQNGMERDYCFESRVFFKDLPSAKYIGNLASNRASKKLSPKKPPTGKFPVIFDERVSSSLISHLISAINGSSISRGASWLLNDLNKKILPVELTLTEEPLRKSIYSSTSFDGEGLPKKNRNFIEDGYLKSWILDLYSSRKLKMAPTSNASFSVSSPSMPTVTNMKLTEGKKSQDELIKDIQKGLLVTSLIGSTINPLTGDYSRGASGFWIENGEICYPVNECTIAGNLREMFRNIITSNDSKETKSFMIPSILVESLTVGGM